MRRFHVNLSVRDLDTSVNFYRTLFNAEPTVVKSDYAKWMLDDPRINFAITTHGNQQGIDHVGIQSEQPSEFQETRERLQRASTNAIVQDDAQCCYANSDKTWIHDPQGLAWETFITHGDVTEYGQDTLDKTAAAQNGACCTPASVSDCCK